MSNRASNMAYLKSISNRLREIPREVAKDVAFHVFTKMVEVTVVDSGQAALNWKIESFNTKPTFTKQKTLWGTNRRSPSGGAGYKSRYSSYGPIGDPALVFATAYSNGVNSLIAMKGRVFNGISVYNPITPGNLSDDRYYEYNALSYPRSSLSEVIDTAFYRAYARAKANYPDLL